MLRVTCRCGKVLTQGDKPADFYGFCIDCATRAARLRTEAYHRRHEERLRRAKALVAPPKVEGLPEDPFRGFRD